jgi:uncharacterized ferritin-like protein (DUF455 family)
MGTARFVLDALERAGAELPAPAAFPALDEGPASVPVARRAPKELPRPARPDGLARGKTCLLDASTTELMKTPEGRARLLFFFFVDIEIAAAEVCAANALLHPEMPVEFRLDMARQIWDEARHARLMRERLAALGASESGMTWDGSVWTRWSAGRDLAERLAIEQIAQEGNALDASASLAPAFRAVGDAETADAFDYLVADEKNHALTGNRWLARLLPPGTDYAAFVDAAAARAGVEVPGSFPPREDLRAAAGFPPGHIEELRRRHFARRAKDADPLLGAALALAAERAVRKA